MTLFCEINSLRTVDVMDDIAKMLNNNRVTAKAIKAGQLEAARFEFKPATFGWIYFEKFSTCLEKPRANVFVVSSLRVGSFKQARCVNLVYGCGSESKVLQRRI